MKVHSLPVRTLLGRCLLMVLALSLASCGNDKSYRMGGQVTGLSAPGLTLVNKDSMPLAVAAGSSSFAFPYRVRKGSDYNVTVATQPDGLICTVTNGVGIVRGTVTNIRVACDVETHSIGGSVTGLNASGLVLRMNGADDLAIPGNASTFEFATPIAAGSGYHVTVLTQPTGLTCTVNNGSASNVNADIGNVQVVCSTSMHSVAGAIGGLTGTGLVLQNNGADDLTLAANATSFQFASPVAYNGTYDVTVLVQPVGQTCTAPNGSGTAQSNITNVTVSCANIPTYSITTSSGANGSISPSGVSSVNEGDSLGFVATPDSGYSVAEWLIDGVLAQSGGAIYQLANVTANHTVSVTFAQAMLSASVSSLALSVNDTTTHAALTGTPRSITIVNVGTISATNVGLSLPAFPVGTTSLTTCSATLAPGNSCSIEITPGAAATSTCTSAIAPTPGVVSISADNAPAISIDVVVLGYGCIYQGGYLFAVDDTTPSTSSIGGKVAATSDQVAPASGIIWSSNGNGGSPSDAVFDDVGVRANAITPCVSSHDGACNTTVILSYYSPASSYPRAYFAAGHCEVATVGGYSDWYLPAACETSSCLGGDQSMLNNIVLNNGLNLLSGRYWSSSEYPSSPTHVTYGLDFPSGLVTATKDDLLGVRCVRGLQ